MLQLCGRNAAAASFSHIAAVAATAEQGLAERMHQLARGTMQILSDAADVWGTGMPMGDVACVLHEALGTAVRPWLATGVLRPSQ